VHGWVTGFALAALATIAGAATPEERAGISAGGGTAGEAHGAAARPLAVVTAERLAGEGDPDGEDGTITSLNSPFTDGNGVPGFTGGATTGNFVWYGSGVVWNNVDALPTVLTGAESTMGVGNSGQFVYSPSIAGDDGVWTQAGELLRDGVQAPGFPAGVTNTFNSRPQMLPSGRALWVSGFNETGGTTTQGRMLYSSTDGTPATIAIVLRSDDLVGGIPIDRPAGVEFDYQLSDDGTHHIHDLLLDTGSTADDAIVYVDGAIAAREGSATGQGDNWSNFDSVSINDSGHYLFSGDTAGATTTDEFIAYDGAIVLREGATVDGITLTSSASVQTLSINNLGHAAHIWSIAGGAEVLFFACDAADLATSSVALLATGDELDLDGDGAGDGLFVADFNASSVIGPGLWLAEDGRVFVEIDVDDGEVSDETIVSIALPSCGAPEIDVTPAALASSQLTNVVTVLPLTVANLGTANLDWTALEAPAACAAPADVSWLSIAPAGGSVSPAGSDVPDVTLDSTGLVPGVYTAALCIASNDADEPLITVPVTLEVLGVPEIDVAPSELASTQLPDVITILPLSIANLGTAALDWSAGEAPADCAAPADVPWLAIAPAAGSVSPGGAGLPAVTFDSTGLAAGLYTARLCIASNDADEPVVAVPVTLQVLFVPLPVQEIPAAGPLGLAVLGMGLAWAAARRLRRG
jgi:hypothetical protein